MYSPGRAKGILSRRKRAAESERNEETTCFKHSVKLRVLREQGRRVKACVLPLDKSFKLFRTACSPTYVAWLL